MPNDQVLFEFVDRIRNKRNYGKMSLFYLESVASAMLYVLRLRYKYPRPVKNMADHVKKTRYPSDLKKLQNVKANPLSIKSFDVTLLYELFCLTTNLSDSVEDKCVKDKMKILKDRRNKVNHKEPEMCNLTDFDISDKCDELILILTEVIEKSSLNIVPQSEKDSVLDSLIKDLKSIRDEKELSDTDPDRLLQLIKIDLKDLHLESLESSFKDELRGYTFPILKYKDDDKEIPIGDILSTANKFVIVEAEAGMGKSALTK